MKYFFTINDMASIEMEKVLTRFDYTKCSISVVGAHLVTMTDYGLLKRYGDLS